MTCEVPVNVVENPFESWEVITDIEVTDHMGGYYDYDNNRNMYYNYNIKELVKVKVKYKSSGEEKVISLRDYASECRYNYNVEITADAYDMPNWRGGGQYSANLIIGYYYIGLTVIVKPGPYDKLNVTLADKKSEYLPYELPDFENAVIELSSTSDSYATKKYIVYSADYYTDYDSENNDGKDDYYACGKLYCKNVNDDNDTIEFNLKIYDDSKTIRVYQYDGAPVYTVNYNVKTDSDGSEITVSDVKLKKQPDDVYGSGAVISVTYSDNTETEITVTDVYGNETSPYKTEDGKLTANKSGSIKFNNGIFPIVIEKIYENSAISQLEMIFCGWAMFADSSIAEKDKVNLSTGFAYFRHLYRLAFNGTINMWNIDMIIDFLYSQNRFYYYYQSDAYTISAELDDVNTAISDIFDVDLSKGDAKLSQYYNSESGCLEIKGGGRGDDFVLKLYKERDHGDGNTSYECIFGHFEEEDSREAVSISLKKGKIAAVSRFVSCGDANADGKIDILDLVRTKKIIAGTASAECAEFAADTNGSGEVNAEDLAWLRYMLINAEK